MKLFMTTENLNKVLQENRKRDTHRRVCPVCREALHIGDTVCPHCHVELVTHNGLLYGKVKTA